jgi:hypothetical protein
MRCGSSLLLATLLTFGPALPMLANSLTIEIRPTDDLSQMVSCTLQLSNDQFVVVEVVGAGFALQTPLRWPASDADSAVLMAALGALLTNDPASVPDPFVARQPEPPYIGVTWMASMTNGLQSGLYLQEGFDLPGVLDRVVDTLLVGGPCARMLGN